MLPGDGKRKKAVVQQTLSMPFYSGGFEQIKAAVLLSSTQNDDALTLAKSAAYGGAAMYNIAFRHNPTDSVLSKKA